jgi:hypothetical protein
LRSKEHTQIAIAMPQTGFFQPCLSCKWKRVCPSIYQHSSHPQQQGAGNGHNGAFPAWTDFDPFILLAHHLIFGNQFPWGFDASWKKRLREFQRGDQAANQSVRIFPNEASCLRLIRALAAETHEDWLEANRYLNMEVLKEHKQLRLSLAAWRQRRYGPPPTSYWEPILGGPPRLNPTAREN